MVGYVSSLFDNVWRLAGQVYFSGIDSPWVNAEVRMDALDMVPSLRSRFPSQKS